MARRDRVGSTERTTVAAGRRGASRAAAVLAALLLGAALTASCAGPKKLTEQSEKALARGDVERAYDKARDALRKDPANEPARRALATAGERKLGAWKERIRAVAAARDTIAAARHCLEADGFRHELAEYRVTPEPDAAFERDEADIRYAAAGILVRRAADEMDTGHARLAYADLTLARDFEPTYPRLAARLREAYAQSIHRIAILPFGSQTEVRGLSTELTDRIYQELARRIREQDFPFTVLIPRDEVYGTVTLAQAENLEPRAAVDLGRALDADYIVRGRVYALRAETSSDSYRQTIYRRVAQTDSSGHAEDRYIDVPLDVSARQRGVSLRCEFEIRDTHDGSVVTVHDETVGSVARVVFTAYRAEGESRDYCLAPPAMKRTDPRTAAQYEKDWSSRCGSWELPAFLERARKGTPRSYQGSMRAEFYVDTAARPVFLADLPPADDLASIALKDSWRPVLGAIRDVER